MPAGASRTYCPTFAKRKPTSAARINSMEPAGHFRFRTCATGIRSPRPMLRRPANLKVVSEAPATRILFDSRRATGLEYLVGNDKHSARARLEVIVASGA